MESMLLLGLNSSRSSLIIMIMVLSTTMFYSPLQHTMLTIMVGVSLNHRMNTLDQAQT